MNFFYARLFTTEQLAGLPDPAELEYATARLTPARGLQTYDEFLLLRVLLRDFLEAAARLPVEAVQDVSASLSARLAVLRAVIPVTQLMASLQLTQFAIERIIRLAHWRQLWEAQTGRRIPAYLRGG